MCLLTAPIAKPCTHSIGGVNKLFLANLDDITAWSDSNANEILDTASMGQVEITGVSIASPAVVTTASAHGFQTGDLIYIVGTTGISGLTGQIEVGATTSTTFEVVGFNNTVAFGSSVLQAVPRPFFQIKTQDNVISTNSNHKVTGGNYYEQSIGFRIDNTGGAALTVVDQLSLGKFVALVLTKNGNWQLYGRQNGLSVRADDGIVITNGPTAADSGITVTLTGDSLLIEDTVEMIDIPMFAL